MPSYQQYSYDGFGGLSLRDAPASVPESRAIDALNVIYTSQSAVTQRSGYRKLTVAEGTNRYDSLTPFYKFDGTKQLVAGAGNRLEAIDTGGAVLASSAAPTASPHHFQRFGGPTGEHLYIANGVDTVRRWDGAAFSTPAYVGTTPTGRFLGLSAADNRLVNARFSGALAGNNPSTVRFSQEGDPLTFDATHYEDLTPGDGEEIMGVATWRDQVIVFKQTKFFVFYGVGIQDDGEPDFNYRPVDAGVGLVAPGALTVTEGGVYFLSRQGVYFTNGGDPQRITEDVEPIFRGTPSVYYLGGVLNPAALSAATMHYSGERLFLSFPSGSSSVNNRQLVFDPQQKFWTLFDLPAGPMTTFRPGNDDELIFGYSSGLKHLGRYLEGGDISDDINTDGTGGTAITARWRGGWFNFGMPLVKSIRETKVAGVGKATVSYYRDYRNNAGLAKKTIVFTEPSALYDAGGLYDAGLLYGPSTQITTKPFRRAVRGEVFSVGLSNDELGKSFSIHQLTTHVREARVPSVVKVS